MMVGYYSKTNLDIFSCDDPKWKIKHKHVGRREYVFILYSVLVFCSVPFANADYFVVLSLILLIISSIITDSLVIVIKRTLHGQVNIDMIPIIIFFHLELIYLYLSAHMNILVVEFCNEQEELKSVDRIPPASRSCKEYVILVSCYLLLHVLIEKTSTNI